MKKGFTLVEVLAVVVVLSIIAVIVTPVVGHIIEDEKIKGAILSAYGYKESVDSIYAKNLLTGNKLDGEYAISGDELIGTTTLELNIGGIKPTGGYIRYVKGELEDACLVIDGYQVRYIDSKFISNGKGNCKNLSFTYYYTFDNEGNMSNIVYKESEIPSDWDFYYETVLGDQKKLYMPFYRLINSKAGLGNKYDSMRDCELNGNACYEKQTYQGKYYVLLGVQENEIVSEEKCQRINEYNNSNLICRKLTNKYLLFTSNKNIPDNYFMTEEECQNKLTSSNQKCEFGDVYVFEKNYEKIYDASNNTENISSCSEINNLKSINGQITSCDIVTSMDLSFKTYGGNFASMDECEMNKHLFASEFNDNNISVTTTCIAYNGYYYASDEIVILENGTILQGEEAKDFHTVYASKGACQYANNDICGSNKGYTVEIKTQAHFMNFEENYTCKSFMNTPSVTVNSCSYEYLNESPIDTEYYGYQNISETYDNIDECVKDFSGCIETKSYVESMKIFINSSEINKKIEYIDDYDKRNNMLSNLFGQGYELTYDDTKAMFYSIDGENISNIISSYGDNINDILTGVVEDNASGTHKIIISLYMNEENIMIIDKYMYSLYDGEFVKLDALNM